MPVSTRRLILMRHAKAESFASEDHERVLTDRGRRDAVEAGSWLAGRDDAPDHVMVSTAARTRGTWDAVAAGSRAEATVDAEAALYTAEPETALEILRGAPADARSLMLIGHNPTVAYLVHLLDSGDGDPEAFRRLAEGYPTAAVTVLEVEGEWADLTEGGARILAFHVGQG